ncbi:MAG TPA: hypothetical protein VJP78_02225 [Thermoleophilia bacterium]|nr:hypothetical protein [Thermoleophilia bacterium]
MHIIVQEGEASISLVAPVQAPDDNLRSASISNFTGPVKVYYRDFKVVHVEAREGALEFLPTSIGAISWLQKGRRYQLKQGD